jgi:very-short-patch-repair endonuclease
MPNKILPYNSSLKHFARKLRNDSTLTEVLLWTQIKSRALRVEFHRQVMIDKYIVDFYCHEIKLAIEIDGSTHENDEATVKDAARQDLLEGLGVTFIRFSDRDIKTNINGCFQALQMQVQELLKAQSLNRAPYRRRS